MATLTPTSRIGHSTGRQTKGKLADFRDLIRMAALRVRVERTVSFAVASFPVAVAGIVLWVALVRFTLLQLTPWVALLPVSVWVVALLVVLARTRVTTGEAARYLDKALGLDERLATYVELVSRPGLVSGSAARRTYLQDLAQNTRQLVATGGTRFPPLKIRTHRFGLLAMPIAAMLLAVLLVVPTPLDAVRLERQRLAQSIQAQVQRIADLRADFVARPQVSDSVRSALLAELDRLEAALKTPGLDRASLLAAVADTQERLREISPDLSSDFEALIRAAQLIQEAAAQTSPWSRSTSKEQTELGLAADAAEYLSNFVISDERAEVFVPEFSIFAQTAAAQKLESAAGVAGARDSSLAKLLQETSVAFREKRLESASRLLKQVAQQFRRIEGRQQAAEAIERALSSLDDGKQSIAQSGESAPKKAQVGFRRGVGEDSRGPGSGPGATPAGNNSATPGGNPPGAPQPPGNPSKPQVGRNAPPLGSSAPGSGPGTQPDEPGPSSGQDGDGQSGGTPKSGEAGDQPGSPGDKSQPGQSDGNLSGPVSGPGGNVTGGITKVENPEGVGVSDGSKPPVQGSEGGSDTVSVPVEGSSGGDSPGDSGAGPDPDPGGQTDGADSGVVKGGSVGSKDGDTGGGSLATIKTPYTEVLGQYVQRAAEALERAYIPQDAKEYVRDYFTILGK